MTKIVSVFGGSAPKPGTAPYAEAQALGAALATAGWTVATGGYSGVMVRPRAARTRPAGTSSASPAA